MIQRNRCHRAARFASALLALVLATACGGGAAPGTPATPAPTPTPTPAADLEILGLLPETIQSNFNSPLTVTGRGFVEPVVVEFLDADGALLGSPMPGRVRDGGTRLDTAGPLLPGVLGTQSVRVRVRRGDGETAEAPRPVTCECPQAASRTIDGSGTNERDATIGAAQTALREDAPRAYADGVSSPAGSRRAGARAVSNAVCAQEGSLENRLGASDMFWLWGQFLDHDIDLTPSAEPAEPMAIAVPTGDAWFDPAGAGGVELGFDRSAWIAGSGTDRSNPRRQVNAITSWIDASQVYGSDELRARALRTLDGTGRLATSDGDLLPFNTAGLPNAPSDRIATFFLAGDIRANEQLGLTAMHTLFVREHNRRADELRTQNPHLDGDAIYAEARRWVGALVQVISVREFLPLLLGGSGLPPYAGYDEQVDASVGVLFSTACYRFGHSMVGNRILRLDAAGNEIAEGHLALRDAFFNPGLLITEGGIDPVLRGFAAQRAQELDARIVDDLRNFLFGAPGAGGLDLAALNIQRGRDHGLLDYNGLREAFGLARHASFDDVTSNDEDVTRLMSVYDNVDDMDVWVAALCEERDAGAMVGPLLQRVLADQFRRLRDGDRFWYERVYAGEALRQLEATRLADVIRRNTGIGGELDDDVLRAPTGAGSPDRPRPRPRGERDPATIAALVGSDGLIR